MNDITNPLGYFIVMASVAGACVLLCKSPYFARLATPTRTRFAALDGLRGLLASGVFVHHAAVNYQFASTGQWMPPDSRLYEMLGGDCVNVFFMITGFLFWKKCLSSGGTIDRRRLIRSRVRRIMPAYLVAAVAVIVLAMAQSGFTLQVSSERFAIEIERWLMGGLLGAPSINGVATTPINSGITWTLQYEWFFYLSLMVVAYFATHRRVPILMGLVLVGVVLATVLNVELTFVGGIARFFMGMLVAHLYVRFPRIPLLRSRGLAAMLVIALMLPTPRAFQALLLWALFCTVIYGNDLFGLLTSRWMTVLGHMSYSLYLIHGIVLYVCIQLVDRIEPIQTMSAGSYWVFIAAMALPLLLVTAAVYRVAEAPFSSTGIVSGKSLSKITKRAS